MILLDTDHFSVLSDQAHSRHAALLVRIEAATAEVFAAPVVTVIEQFQGWTAVINKQRDLLKQVPAYLRLTRFVESNRSPGKSICTLNARCKKRMKSGRSENLSLNKSF